MPSLSLPSLGIISLGRQELNLVEEVIRPLRIIRLDEPHADAVLLLIITPYVPPRSPEHQPFIGAELPVFDVEVLRRQPLILRVLSWSRARHALEPVGGLVAQQESRGAAEVATGVRRQTACEGALEGPCAEQTAEDGLGDEAWGGQPRDGGGVGLRQRGGGFGLGVGGGERGEVARGGEDIHWLIVMRQLGGRRDRGRGDGDGEGGGEFLHEVGVVAHGELGAARVVAEGDCAPVGGVVEEGV